MIYIDKEHDGSADWATRKYHGAVATGYNAKRENSPKWIAEDKIIKGILSDLPESTKVLDIPTGTGRFLPYMVEKKFQVYAVDVSEDMLKEAHKVGGDKVNYRVGNVLQLESDSTDVVDVSLMIRLTRWLSHDDRHKALVGLQNVTKSRIVFTARVANHPHAYEYKDIKKSLYGWKISQDHQVGDDENYRVIVLEPDGCV